MSDLRRTPRRYSDEALTAFRAARWLGSRVWPGRLSYRRYLARGGLRAVDVRVPVAGLPAPLHGFRIVQLSDLHAGVFLDERTLEPVVALARSYAPHVLALTGDFITSRTEEVALLGRAFAAIPASRGKFAVFGNHDYRGRREGAIAAALRRQGVVTLRNASVLVEHGGCRVRITGLEDIEEGKVADLDAALADSDGREHVRILLCHHPDVVDQLAPGAFHLVLSGHSHGGQINLPLLGSLGRRWMPTRVAGPFPLPGGGLLHVNRGIGVLIVPLRIGAPAEVSCLELQPA